MTAETFVGPLSWALLFYLVDNPCSSLADLWEVEKMDRGRGRVGIPSIFD